MNLLVVEMRRALHRRVVRTLILLALAACVFAGVIAFTSSSGKTVAELRAGEDAHPAVLTDWWNSTSSDGVVIIATLLLLLGAVFGGAAVAGAEWRAGTVTTVLTWEPRRIRLFVARTAACGILAFFIALGLQVFFLASFVPAVLANGTTTGAHADWWMSLTQVIVRTALLTSLAAVLGVALATLGRNTAFALAAVFAWVAVIEGLIRGLRPGWAPFLLAENIGIVVPWSQTEDADFTRAPGLALGTIVLYATAIVVAAGISFRRRDITGAS